MYIPLPLELKLLVVSVQKNSKKKNQNLNCDICNILFINVAWWKPHSDEDRLSDRAPAGNIIKLEAVALLLVVGICIIFVKPSPCLLNSLVVFWILLCFCRLVTFHVLLLLTVHFVRSLPSCPSFYGIKTVNQAEIKQSILKLSKQIHVLLLLPVGFVRSLPCCPSYYLN